MKWTYTVAAVLVLCTVGPSQSQRSDLPSAFQKCRTVTTGDLIDKTAPIFSDYPVPPPEPVKHPRLDLSSNAIARTYRTVLRTEIARGPNFAGPYRVAVWGCGSSCSMFAVVNLDTGRVITPEGFSHTSGVFLEIDNQKLLPESQSEYSALGFRKDSRLIVVLGDLDEDENREGAFYLTLEHERLRLIHSTRVKKDCEDSRTKQ